MNKIKIHTDYINLGQFLKVACLIVNGGEAKYYLQEHQVLVNGNVENRRGRKLYVNDTIEVAGQEYVIVD